MKKEPIANCDRFRRVSLAILREVFVSGSIVPKERIERTILLIRGQRVIIDSDLARLYGVATGRLNEQIKRNLSRFPDDFIFQLTTDEKNELIANCDRFRKLKHSAWLPYAFTEHGVIMAANVLRSERAIEVSVFVVRAFIKLREGLKFHAELAQKLSDLEKRISTHDEAIRSLFTAIRQLMDSPKKQQKKIGF